MTTTEITLNQIENILKGKFSGHGKTVELAWLPEDMGVEVTVTSERRANPVTVCRTAHNIYPGHVWGDDNAGRGPVVCRLCGEHKDA